MTGIKNSTFAVNVDTRKGKPFYNDLISVILDDAIPTVWFLRKVLIEEVSYINVLKRLKFERTDGSVYFVISGV